MTEKRLALLRLMSDEDLASELTETRAYLKALQAERDRRPADKKQAKWDLAVKIAEQVEAGKPIATIATEHGFTIGRAQHLLQKGRRVIASRRERGAQ